MKTRQSFPNVSISVEREQVEVTYGGLFGGQPDYHRKFVPGLASVTVTIDGERFVMTPEEYAESVDQWARLLRRKNRRGR